mmetsp:Transcript_8751/g.13061  ORF Transcript_8751/g.13061 Transcript_8751/m.13061 type:complete len:428 (-) Transcript_8751:203-1486(-)|eukprot:CAMPEP_0203677674 /NCGR_PEP_ID=MMETSP0090-20130426/29064_1 /ASSEMBLY_ACC=CAM_ASM_001088 /TAXON_ID=426623 /ORGANISM="Chaetoceros affinis, Strain CCMP159" /LENGTH=427 /DNA_ID=CAMNT_0050544635 /DNA_START=76 /DNA_END=1359 /DNA_ORIENTATION=+
MLCFGKKRSARDTDSRKLPPETSSPPPSHNAEKKGRSESVDKFLSSEQKKEEGKLKLLLLGTGESGKSTIFKQFRILYGTRKSDDDLRMYGVVVRSNVITAITKLGELTRELRWEHSLIEESDAADAAVPQDASGMSVKDAYDQIMGHLVDNNATHPLPEFTEEQLANDWVGTHPRAGAKTNSDAIRCLQLVDAIEVLWQSPTIQAVWRQRAAKNINDSHGCFLTDVKRIASPNFIPTEDDILKCRLRTTQVVVERYNIEGVDFEICDVGGQRTERRKWINCFNDVNAVIFVAALSEYDQKLAEAKTQNRMVEALNLFGSIVKNAYFEKTPIMLFLNKKDIFLEKIQHSDIGKVSFFHDYGGPPNDFDYGVLYFIQKFEEQLEGEFNDNFIHVTNATDTTNMEFVLNASRLIILKENFDKAFGCYST